MTASRQGVMPFLLEIARLHTATDNAGLPRVGRGDKRTADPKHVVIKTPGRPGSG